MFQTGSIIEQEEINYMHNTKDGLVSDAWEKNVLDNVLALAKNGESLGISLFISNLLISYLPLLFWLTEVFAIKKHSKCQLS